jgi:heme A synthase
MIFGVYSQKHKADGILLADDGESVSAAAIILGCIVTMVSFIGCCGAVNEKGILLKTYFVFMLILIILQITAGSLAINRKDKVNISLFLTISLIRLDSSLFRKRMECSL